MKAFKWIFAAVILFNVQTVSAQSNSACNPCNTCFSDCNFSIYGDYLYWKVCRGGLNYDSDDDDESVKYVNPDYDHGWRAGFRIGYNCWDLGARYTNFKNNIRRTHNEDNIEYDIDYKVVDIEFGYTLSWKCNDINLRPFTGAKLAWIDERYDNEVSGEDDKLDYEGYGAYVGMETHLKMCGFCDIGIYFTARGSYGVLDSQFKVKRENSPDFPKDCLYVPYVEAFAGLDISLFDYCGVSGNITVGYEAQQWGDYREFDQREDAESLGMGGLVARFSIGF